jgi:bacterial/archaeal transporter family-2 protein
MLSSSLLPILAILVAGSLPALQSPMNATLGRAVGSPLLAALVSFLVGTLLLVVAVGLQWNSPSVPAIRALPWWAWLGGACGAAYVSVAAFAAPRVGTANMLTMAIASQLLTSVVLDHTGAFGMPARAAGTGRLLGIFLVIVGTLIVRRF